MKDTVLFDLDGTLVNSLEDLTDSTNYTMKMLGCPERTLDEVRSFIGNGAVMLITRALPENRRNEIDNAMEIYRGHYNSNVCNKTKPYDGICQLLTELKEKGFKTGIVTNKPQKAAELIAEKLFKSNIDAVVGSDTAKRKNKPCSDSVDYCLELLGSSRDRAIYVGDSEVDAQTAENADLFFIGAAWGFRDKTALKGADVIADDAYDLRKAILNQLERK